ncbi:MAG: SDR family NAD(P)-dependent oxidoreductase [Oligoflexales bacterium]
MINERLAFVTGASGGIGRELAFQFKKDGFRLGLFARRLTQLESLKNELASVNDLDVEVFQCDVAKKESVNNAFSEAFTKLGSPYLLVANAGVGGSTSVRNFDTEVMAKIFQTNVMGAIYCISEVLPSMLTNKQGHIVGISSLAAYRSFPYTHAYSASKSALSAHLQGLALELSPHGIKVSTICPGFIKTSMTEKNKFSMPFIMDADQAAKKIMSAIKKEKKVYNFPWQTYLLVKASHLLPSSLVTKKSKN